MARQKAPVGHKERRKQAKDAEKRKRQAHHAMKQKAVVQAAPEPQPQPSKKRKKASKSSRDGSGAATQDAQPKTKSTRKRTWDSLVAQPAAVDPEDEEIARLERLLGVKGPNADKKKAKLNRELAEQDGLGDDFGAFLEGLDAISGAAAAGDPDEEAEDWSGSESGAEEQERHAFDDLPTDSEGSDAEDFDPVAAAHQANFDYSDSDDAAAAADGAEHSGDSDSDSDNSDADTDDDETATTGAHSERDSSGAILYRPVAGQDIYGRSTIGDAEAMSSASKYVPPHMRAGGSAAASKGDAERLQRLKRTLQGQLNRMSEDNLQPVANALCDLYRDNSTTDMNHLLVDATCAVCVHDTQVRVYAIVL
jgi:nucleolar MIF4G domain-containing protein 1